MVVVVEWDGAVLVEHIGVIGLPVGLELAQARRRQLGRGTVVRVVQVVQVVHGHVVTDRFGIVVEGALGRVHDSIVRPRPLASQGRTALSCWRHLWSSEGHRIRDGEVTMRILIAVASRHGSTAEIADRLAERLTQSGHRPHVFDLVHARERGDELDDLTQFDAYVIGSAIYEGHWLRQARTFALRNAAHLQHAPVFLFSSGPIGDSEHVDIDADKIDELVHAVDAIEHRVFSGRLDRGELGRLERWIVDVVRARDGDFRDWTVIDAWAAAIDIRLSTISGSA